VVHVDSGPLREVAHRSVLSARPRMLSMSRPAPGVLPAIVRPDSASEVRRLAGPFRCRVAIRARRTVVLMILEVHIALRTICRAATS
jgi:hypothetical protein